MQTSIDDCRLLICEISLAFATPKRGPRGKSQEPVAHAPVLKLRYITSFFGQRPFFTVAWGIAPGIVDEMYCLAEGHIHNDLRGGVSMAFGQKRWPITRT